MKPILDISNKNSFTVWESCVWKDDFHSSILVADQESNKLQVIYDKDPTRTSTHALFYANVGNVLAGCFVKLGPPKNRKNAQIRIELCKIESLTTKQIQGNSVPTAKLAVIHLSNMTCVINYDAEPDYKKLIGEFEDLPSLPNARELMQLAIKKAMTKPAEQRLFWGIPRVKQEQD